MNKKTFHRLITSLNHSIYALFNSSFNFLVSLLIVRLHSAQLWGEFAKYQITILLISLIINWGQKEFLLKQLSKGKPISLWLTSLGTRFALFIFIIPVLLLIFNVKLGLLISLWGVLHTLYHSFDSLITFNRKFSIPFFLDLLSFTCIILTVWLLANSMNGEWLILIFSLTALMKCIVLFFYFKKEVIVSGQIKIGPHYLIESFPFFLPSLIGFIQSRADTFTVAYYLPKEDLGKYYLFMNLLFYCQFSVLMLFAPFKKNIYRLQSNVIRKMAFKLFLIGVPWSIFGLTLIFVITHWIYLFTFSTIQFALAFLVVLPYFYYFIRMYELFSKNREYNVSITFFLSGCLNLLLSLVLIPTFHITGALIANASGQWLNFFLFEYFSRKISQTNTFIHLAIISLFLYY